MYVYVRRSSRWQRRRYPLCPCRPLTYSRPGIQASRRPGVQALPTTIQGLNVDRRRGACGMPRLPCPTCALASRLSVGHSGSLRPLRLPPAVPPTSRPTRPARLHPPSSPAIRRRASSPSTRLSRRSSAAALLGVEVAAERTRRR